MLSPLERMIAFRYLRARRKEGFISVIAGFSLMGVALGVAALIVVMAVMNGFQKELMDRILGFNGHIQVYALTSPGIDNYEQIANRIRMASGVTSAVPLVEGQVMATSQQNSAGALVKGIRTEDLAHKALISQTLDGDIKNFTGEDSVIIGRELANTLGLHKGDAITLISPQGTATVMGFVPRVKSYTIIATFNAGMYQYDSSVIFMPLQAAQTYFRYPSKASTIEVMTSNPAQVSAISSTISHLLERNYRIVDWQIANSHFFTALKVERSVMFMILALIIVVAAFNIISSLIMLVSDKQSDIAILRTMGATRGMIMRIFILCGSAIGVVGTSIGLLLGVSFSLNIETIRQWLESLTGTRLFDPVIYYLAQLPADVHLEDVGNIVAMSLTLAFLATLYPAWKAAQQNPAEALRYE
jgi:lipoprotein-releasing system permease protein